MTKRYYLSGWTFTDRAFHPIVGIAIESVKGNWIAVDLRTAEEQLTANGKCIVIADLTAQQHNAVKTSGTWIRPGVVKRADLVTALGSEGIPAAVDVSNDRAVEALAVRIHKARVNRWKGR